MAKYKLTNKAVEDLTDIWEYTFEEWSEKQADLYYELLIGSCEDISRNQLIGKNYDEVMDAIKGLNVGKHIIFYRSNNQDMVEIIRILHGMMDLKKRIKD